jgi:predicted permease
LRAALRLLVKDRSFSTSVILTLAVCLGANAAVFTVVESVLLRPMPFPEADRIVGIGDVYPTITPNDILSNDVPSYFDRLTAVDTLAEQALFTFWFDTIVINGVAEEMRGMRVSPSLFPLLRVPPALGRTFSEAEAEIGAEQKIVLSHGLWQRLYGGDPAVIGTDVRLGWTGRRYTIVGVMPPGFAFFDRGDDGHAQSSTRGVQFWIPLALTAAQKSDGARTRYGYFHIGRLRAGATVDQVQAQIDAVHAAIVKRFPEFRYSELGMYTLVTPLQDALTRDIRGTLYLLWGAAGFVLLIGAINIANLARARARLRARELATRLSLGARRLQVARQLILEGLLPAAIGGVAATGVAAAILGLLRVSGMAYLPNAGEVRIEAPTFAFVGAVCALVGVLIGLVPAMSIGNVTLNQVLADGSRSGTSGRAARLFGNGLVVTEVALSVVLLIGATLLLTSFRHLLSIDAGFTAARVTTATIFPPPSRYPDDRAMAALIDRFLDAMRALPGVEAAGITSNVPLSGFESPSTVSAAEDRAAAATEPLVPSVISVTPGYFEAMRTPLLAGRRFDARDRADSMRVAVLDERLAARLWPDQDPIGKAVYRGDAGPYTVVGVVGEVRFESLAGQKESIGTAYFPHTQAPPMPRLRWIAVKSVTDPEVIAREARRVLATIDPELPLSDISTMEQRTSRSLVPERLAMGLAALFGLIALFLSMFGIYAVLAYVVAQRTREIGIRIALGSTVRGIFDLVFREGLTLVVAGLIIGLAGAVAVGRILEDQVFGVRPTDPVILVSVAVVTGLVALVACVAPSIRATRVDPVEVLNATP